MPLFSHVQIVGFLVQRLIFHFILSRSNKSGNAVSCICNSMHQYPPVDTNIDQSKSRGKYWYSVAESTIAQSSQNLFYALVICNHSPGGGQGIAMEMSGAVTKVLPP